MSETKEGPAAKAYDPKKDPGPERYEDLLDLGGAKPRLSAEEVPLEKSRKDETTLLAGETYPGELK